MFCLVFSVFVVFTVEGEDAAEAVANADVALRDAFLAVSNARASGANISVLIDKLTEAGAVLTSAKVALEMGNYNDAVDRADMCASLVSSIVEDASVLKIDAVATVPAWLSPMSLSVVSSALFVIGLFLVWRRFKRSYEAKLFESKPEVVE